MANGGKYYCWGDDHEDLTEKVEKAKQEADPVFRMAARRPGAWRVDVTCREGHENIFEGADDSHTDEGHKYGRPPDKDDQYWLNQATNITPEKSIERLDAQGKYLFQTVSTVGTLLTGFGIFSPSGFAVMRSPWLVVPVLFACLSLADRKSVV